MYKTCNKCINVKPLEEFNKNPRAADGYRNQCKACKKLYYSEYQKTSKAKKAHKFRVLKYKFNLTEEQYNQLFNDQKGCCGICEKHQSEFKIVLAVDHCHVTGKVRGLLCASCNRGIGYLKDSTANLKNAISYLEPHKITLTEVG